jgi:hypothetical protein
LGDGLITLNGTLGIVAVDGIIDIPTSTALSGQITQAGVRLIHTCGTDNLFVGELSGNFTATGSQNVGLGNSTGFSLTSGTSNMLIGRTAGNNLTTGSKNMLIGSSAGQVISSGDDNVGLGNSALLKLTTGRRAIAIGSSALSKLVQAGTVASVVIGHIAGVNNTSGTANTLIGYASGNGLITGNNNLFLGYFSGAFHNTNPTSNTFILDALNRTNEAGEIVSSLFYGKFNSTVASQTLTINATTTIGNATTNQQLTVTGVVKSESGRIPKTTRLTADGTTLGTAQHEVFCNTDGGAFTVTLPATPVGQTYRITNSGNNNLTVGRNGNTIKGSATDAIIPSGDTLILTWEPTEGWW